MICVSIAEPTPTRCLEALQGLDFAEIRIDRLKCEVRDMRRLFSHPSRLIATCRPGEMPDSRRQALLSAAISAGAAYVDVEVEAEEGYRSAILEKARSAGCRVIISYHNLEETPATTELQDIVRRCFASGGDVAKVACRVHSGRDNARLLALAAEGRPLVVVGLGRKGRICRIAAPFLGSPFTYASPAGGKETADGQMDRKTLEEVFRIIADV